MAMTKNAPHGEIEEEEVDEERTDSEEEVAPVTRKRRKISKTRASASSSGAGSLAQTVCVERGATLPTRRARGQRFTSGQSRREDPLNVVRDLRLHAPHYSRGRNYYDYRKDFRGLESGRLVNPLSLMEKEASDNRFHTWFQQDFYMSMIFEKKKTESHILRASMAGLDTHGQQERL